MLWILDYRVGTSEIAPGFFPAFVFLPNRKSASGPADKNLKSFDYPIRPRQHVRRDPNDFGFSICDGSTLRDFEENASIALFSWLSIQNLKSKIQNVI
jgi:hypothetical protein